MTSYLFLDPDSVPAEWADRVVPMAMVPLTEAESGQLLSDEPVTPDRLMPDADLMRLVARGLSAEVIARRLDLAPRSVYRRLARLRDAFGVSSTAELAAELAARGFGAGDLADESTGATP